MSEARENNVDYHDSFLDGNELVEKAISDFCKEMNEENFIIVLEAIRQRMHEDGHFIFPVMVNDKDQSQFTFHVIETNDGKLWNAAFTSQSEYEKGESTDVISYFIDSAMKYCLASNFEGFIINPWGQSFFLAKESMERIFEADGGVEYTVPDDPITEELLEDGSFLKRATEICNRNRTQLNLIKLVRIMRDSYVWIPCNAILSDDDYENWSRLVMDADEQGDLDSLTGREVKNQDNIRLVPDILQNGDAYFFPVFTSEDEMGEYGNHFSKVCSHFLQAINLAQNNEKEVEGIVINAFSEPFVIPKEMFDIIAETNSALE